MSLPPKSLSRVLCALLLAFGLAGASSVAGPVEDMIDFVTVRDPGNPDDDETTPEGKKKYEDYENASVGYVGQIFEMGETEITNEMYARFLNAVARTDRLFGLYTTKMSTDPLGGINRSGSSGSYIYAVKAGFGQRPVNFVSGFDAMRFVNWLHNGMPGDPQAEDPTRRTPLVGDQNASSTEDGAYTLLGKNNNEIIRRNQGARYFIPDKDEWHKAAFFDPSPGIDPSTGLPRPSDSYWWYADQTTDGPGGNFFFESRQGTGNVLVPTQVGTFSGPSHYGTYDQDGNVDEWLDDSISSSGGETRYAAIATPGQVNIADIGDPPVYIYVRENLSYEALDPTTTELPDLGFRVARPAGGVPFGQQTIPLMVEVGEPGNLADEEFAPELGDPKLGGVTYAFQMGAYEVSNREYLKFLEAKAKNIAVESLYRLYDARMGSDDANGGIRRRDNGDGTYSYWVKRSFGRKPVVYVSIYSAMRYCNWLHNGGRPDSDMEEGAYRLLGNVPPNTESLTRNATARYYLPNANEFYKAAYYDKATNEPAKSLADATFNYWKFATRSDTFNAPNNNAQLDDVDFSSMASYFGTYGQSGNIGYVNPGSGPNMPAPKPTASNTGELLEEATNNDDEFADRTFRIAAAEGVSSLRPDQDADGDGLLNGWEVLNDLSHTSDAGDDGAAGDPDKDGLLNSEEQTAKTDPKDSDTDIDDLTDFEELRTYLTDPKDSDTDNDGLTDGAEVKAHLTDPKDSDTDNDGLSDGAEVNEHGSNPRVTDTDGDGLGDAAEVNNHQTNPANADTDGDGMRDGWEVQYNFNPKDPTDAALDTDSDGLTNLQEFVAGTNPRNGDTDGDGLGDKWEVDNGLNPANGADGAQDTDGDGLTNLRELQLGTNPRNPDTDGDGMPDGWEVQNGLNPLVNDAVQDPDGDGLTNLREFQLGTNPKNRDTDGDRITDGDEVGETSTNPLLADTDTDGMTDYQEIYVFGTDPLVASAIPDVPFFVSVGDPSNPDEDVEGEDLQNAGIGYVGQTFEIGLTEVTNLMYAKFLNAMAKSDAIFGLYSAEMGSSPRGGIRRTGTNGSYVYTVKPGFETRPVNYVSVFDAMRYCNWLHNGMPTTGVPNATTTEDGAYKLDGANRPEMVRRSFGAKYFLPDQDEWHKAAYYDPAGPSGASQDYWFFADKTSVGPGGNFGSPRNKPVGTSSDASHYGTFDQDGNIREWLDATLTGSARMAVGGGCDVTSVPDEPDIVLLTRKAIDSEDVLAEKLDLGFRVARPVNPIVSAPPVLPRMVTVGSAGNLPDTNGKGSVPYVFQIGAYEVTNTEYALFLNAVAKHDSPYNLYDERMTTDQLGGILRSGAPGSYAYTVKEGHADRPVNFVTLYNAMRYCNWLHNGAQAGSDTESGAYRLLGNLPPDTTSVPRNFGARYFLPDEDEWHKAAYYDPSPVAAATGNYWAFAVRSDNATPSQAAVHPLVGLIDVNKPGIPSFFGTFGQTGNAAEWSEERVGESRLSLGGGFLNWTNPAFAINPTGALSLLANPQERAVDRGFRVAARSDSPSTLIAPPGVGIRPQFITFSRPPLERIYRPGRLLKISLKAKSSSGLPVVFESSNTAIAKVMGNRNPYLLITGTGTVKVTARQPGDTQWAAAANVDHTINIVPAKAKTPK